MFQKVKQICSQTHTIITCVRNLTTTEVSTALRPFYFSVHPDLFGKYPVERATNESSLQQLSSLLANLQALQPIRPMKLEFYIKGKTQSQVSFRLVNIHIRDRDIRAAVLTILKSCGLSTDYVDSIIKPNTITSTSDRYKIRYKNDIDFTKVNENHPIYAHIVMQKKMKEAQDALKLRNWLKNNYKDALQRSKQGEAYREEIRRLCESITDKFKLKEIRWECGWNDTHFRGCLLSFQSLIEHHPEIMNTLQGRILVFSFFTGVSLDGHIMLYSGEVRHNWLDVNIVLLNSLDSENDSIVVLEEIFHRPSSANTISVEQIQSIFLKNIRKYDTALKRIPAFEKSLSHVLRNIKVGRRKFMPKVIAGTYEQNLRQITTSLSDFRGRKPFPKEWPESLENFEIVVETEAGPLMVSPTGQFIVPATLPGDLLVNFITINLEEACKKNMEYQSDKHLERYLIKKCLTEFNLAALKKEDNVTPDLMIKCCKKLLDNKSELQEFTKELRINISTYYSVLSDGIVCIPWNFNL